MFAIAGVTGNTGSVVANTLLAQSVPVRVIVRDAKKGEAWKAKGAEVAVADLKDGKALTAALKGVVGAYFLSPPNMAAADINANALELGNALKAAVTENGVGHVVFLSSIGAQHSSGTGPISSLHLIEGLFRDARTHFTALRAGFFMENLLGNLSVMKEKGIVPAMFNPEKKADMVATADIGAVAAELLRAGTSAPKVVELSGPRPTSIADVAQAFGNKLGKKLTISPVPQAAHVGLLTSFGLNETWAKAYAEMYAGMEANKVVFEGTPRRGLIDIEHFVAHAVH